MEGPLAHRASLAYDLDVVWADYPVNFDLGWRVPNSDGDCTGKRMMDFGQGVATSCGA